LSLESVGKKETLYIALTNVFMKKKENLYIALINVFIGTGISFLLKGSVLAVALTVIVIGTMIFIERKWIYENVFRRKKPYAVAGYFILAALMLVFLFLITSPSRDISHIIKLVNGFLQDVTAGNYRGAYEQLSDESKKSYTLNDFTKDHVENRVKIQNYRIDQVIFNEYDKRKAVAVVSSPFTLYGRETLNLESIKEKEGWRIVFSRTIFHPSALGQGNSKKKAGFITNFFNKLF
jgi:4-amino-4-deoxy-L-arabinose transferase-like glycosyltransferase